MAQDLFIGTFSSKFGDVLITPKSYDHFKQHLKLNDSSDYFTVPVEKSFELLKETLKKPDSSYVTRSKYELRRVFVKTFKENIGYSYRCKSKCKTVRVVVCYRWYGMRMISVYPQVLYSK